MIHHIIPCHFLQPFSMEEEEEKLKTCFESETFSLLYKKSNNTLIDPKVQIETNWTTAIK